MVLTLPAGAASAAVAGGRTSFGSGKAYSLPHTPAQGRLGSFAASQDETPVERAEAAAAAEAASLGHSVPVAGLTTEREMVTASPDGMFTMTSYPLPVRVRQDGRWVPVSTNLRRTGAMLAAPALPGDSVQFSAGGLGPMAVIGTGSASLALWWPGRLPVPVVSGPSATYTGVLPGVNLVLTAENGTTGAFSEVLVVTSPQAAREVAAVSLRVTTRGTVLEQARGGGLVAPLAAGGGAFVAPPSVMWDSGTSARSVVERATAMGGRAAGVTAAGGVVLPSTAEGPGRFALTGRVAAQVADSGRLLRLVPDAALLDSPQAVFPEYVDPTLYLETNGGGSLQDYDPVQSDDDNGGSYDTNCTGSHWNSSSYYDSPVGYDNFEAGDCEYSDTDYALYRVGMSTALGTSGVTVATATVNASVAYSSDCGVSSVVTLSWIDGMSSSTGWPGPSEVSGESNATATFPPDTDSSDSADDSCDNTVVEDDGLLKSEGFNVIKDVDSMKGSSNFTFRLWEPSGSGDGSPTNEDYHVQFTNGKHDSDGPYLQVQYFYTPSTPSTTTMEESTASNDSSPYTCATATSSAQALVPTEAGGGVYVGATYSDPDGHSVLSGNVKYWLASASSTTYTTASPASATPSSSGSYSRAWDTAPIPWSFLDDQTNGAVIGWSTDAETGTDKVSSTTYGPYSSAYSADCYFADYWQKPEPPGVAADFTQADAQSVGSTISFAITPSANDSNAVSEYVFGLDGQPPTSGTIPDSQLCTTSSTTTPDCVINSSGDATLSVVVGSPGPHLLYVYEIDSKSVVSGETEGALGDSSTDCQNAPSATCAWAGYTFTGAADAGASYTSGSSLQANFAAALASGYADNTMISNSSGASCNGGYDFYAPQLTAAGWTAGGQVTVDGASFTLADYGSCGADNLLAAKQTIGTGGSGVNGSAVVFLATSSLGEVGIPGVMTGDPNASVLQSDVTAPAVMHGVGVTGSGCIDAPSFGDAGCIPATGTVNYASGCVLGTQVSYDLTVPDWVEGPSDIQAISTADRVAGSSGEQADSPKIYAFSVPLDPSCTLQSVTLPDVGDTSWEQTASGDGAAVPTLDVFGVSVRNTTTETPVQPTVSSPAATPCAAPCLSPAGDAWTGIWANPMEDAYEATDFGNETIRIGVGFNALSAGAAIPAGSQIRIRLSNPGFMDGDGDGPIQIGAASVSLQSDEAKPTGTPSELYFGGGESVTIPEGGDVYSDPLTLPIALTPGYDVLVSLWVENSSLAYLPLNATPAAAGTWYAAEGSGDNVLDATGTPFDGSTGVWYGNAPLLSGVDVTTAAPSPELAGLASPGAPTVVVAGNNVTDIWTATATSDSIDNPSKRLAGQLYSQGIAAGYGVVDAGIQSNQVLNDGSPTGGVSLLARLDRDILAEPDVGTVIIDEGLEDLLLSADGKTTVAASELNMDTAYAVLINQLNAFGINVIVGTLTPCDGYDNSSTGETCTSTVVDPTRVLINEDMNGGNPSTGITIQTGEPYCTAQLDQAVSNGGSPEALATSPTDFDNGDHVNLTWAGYAAMAAELNPANTADSPCSLSPNSLPQPPS
ncbi:MAG TPA: hypothetical protein VEL03_21455 [Streptosporangiaceae bacterium]|nr:hypothetical protein [Streptosporangiaceae bacterium]